MASENPVVEKPIKVIDKHGIQLAHILAMSANNCIGKDNDLPWHISADLQHFKKLTQGGVLVLGRKCYESFGGRPLPNRSHWVITRNADWQTNHTNTEKNPSKKTTVQVVHSIKEALNHAIAEAKAKKLDTVWIIGGGEIYKETLSIVDRLEITHIAKQVDGDTFYPELNDVFLERFSITKQAMQRDEKSGLNYQFVSYLSKGK